MDPVFMLALVASAGVAAAVLGLLGFGFGLTMISLAPWFMPIDVAIPVTAGLSLPLTMVMAWRHRRDVQLRRVLPLLIGCIPGVAIGVFMLKELDEGVMKAALGIFLMVYAVGSLSAPGTSKLKIGPQWGWGVGFAGGVFGGAFNCSGPPVVLYATLRDMQKGALVGTLQGFFIVQGIFTTGGMALTGLINTETLLLDLYLLPVVGGGIWLGDAMHHRIDQQSFKRVVLIAIGITGLALVAPALSTLSGGP